ncbi:protein FAR1-RELATED SEQUENCE 6-like [Chenopodium quinoa]|uniref:protein FAR1-RELATED SEQUENCE 6-like n=1 Tax=Chenopodium quinoa TaxID=63459 RepID=UPI000B786AC7|nr:protein FAR1-RELATED SEQUENCE 6-like [Chenopodium quinoa]
MQTIETVVSTNRRSPGPVVETPKVGMVFRRWEDIEIYYKKYGEQEGFGVTRVQGTKSKVTNERKCMTWKCECWGAPNMRAQREAKKRAKAMDVGGCGGNVNGVIGVQEHAQGKRKSKKCYCPVKIYAGVNEHEEWELRKVCNEHNHDQNPSDAVLVKEYRMKNYTSNEVLPSLKYMEHEVYKARRLKMEDGDATAMMAYFDRMQADNQNFFHCHRLDTHGRLKDVLWVDARSRAAYEYFGDLVCFDATYLTNRYELPFANFVGVNHHGQSILLGCALVSREDAETYTWVFRQWLASLGNRPPLAILTDQAASMRKALVQTMPSSRHRWCIWHIVRKFGDKLGKCDKYKEFKSPLKAIIYESFTAEEFERRWHECIKKYKLEKNEWLDGLFKERHMWIPAYMREYFWAGMKTTQRVESINSFFDAFVNRKTRLCEFLVRYTRAMKKRVSDENEADAKATKYIRRLVRGFKHEKLFQKLYTDAKFQEIQSELTRMMYCYDGEVTVIDESTTRYVIDDRVWIVPEGESEEVITDRRCNYFFIFNHVTKEVSCDCRRFEAHGILCKHCIRVLDKNKVVKIPDKYIVDRWRKDIVRKHTRVRVAYYDPTRTPEVKKFNNMMNVFEPICDDAAVADDETVDIVVKALSKLHSEVKERRKKYMELMATKNPPSSEPPPQSEIDSNSSCPPQSELGIHSSCQPSSSNVQATILDPPIKKRPRGRTKGSRNKSYSETGYKPPKTRKTKGANQNDELGELQDLDPSEVDVCNTQYGSADVCNSQHGDSVSLANDADLISVMNYINKGMPVMASTYLLDVYEDDCAGSI